jgi:hypothetical protein
MNEQKIKELEKHSQMLGIIGMHLEEFSENDNDTTLTAVLRLLSKYRYLQYELSLMDLEKNIQDDLTNTFSS